MVTSGTHENYNVEGLFSTKENALAFMRNFSLDYNEIKELKINPFEEEVKLGLQVFDLEVSKDGFCFGCNKWDHGLDDVGEVQFHANGNMRMRIFASDKEDAIKRVEIKRLEIIENNNWPIKQRNFYGR